VLKPLPTPAASIRTEAERNVWLTRELQRAELKILVLQAQLRLALIAKYGRKSESLNDAQLQLLDLEPGVSSAEVEAESGREPLPESTPATEMKSRETRHPGRQELPAHLPRIEKVIACTPEQCVCQSCGKDTAIIGYDRSEQLDVEPARYFVVVTKREKRACQSCAAGIASAPLPERIVDKGLVSDRVVIDTLVNKYCDHLPLYRQSAILEREAGISIGRATLDGWVMRVGELLIPVAAAIGKELLGGGYIQADETPVPVQTREGNGRNHQAYLWQYGKPGGSVVFEFRMGRNREGPKQFLGGYEGILQTDGYAAYDRVGAPKMVHAGCWAHARRKIHDALKLNPEDRMARALVGRMDALFAIDAEARKAGLDASARQELRRERAVPLLETIRLELNAARAAVLPSSALGKGAAYTLGLWHKLTRFVEHAVLELSNNLAENSMRGVALGRKNWIHVGSEKAGPKVAAILSAMESCRRLGLPVREYLAAVLPGLADMPRKMVGEVTPAAWAARRSAVQG
jgi:transposase